MTELERVQRELEMIKIDLRNAQQETLSVKYELRKATSFYIECWEDYKDLEYSEDNYKSLQILMKKMIKGIKKVSGD